MRYLRLLPMFFRASAQQEAAYQANFWINLLHSLLNLGTGVLGMSILFGQVSSLQGWDYPSALTLVGVYLSVSALRSLFIGPSLESLAGLGQEIWSGGFDFSLLRPVNTQFLVTFRVWRPFALIDLALGLGVIAVAISQSSRIISINDLLVFFCAFCAAILVLYALLLAFTALVFWNPALLFTWVFDAIFQLARYPVNIYPGWLRLVLTWVVPVGLITTLPAQALTGQAGWTAVLTSLGVSLLALAGASWMFSRGLRRYASASS